MNQNISHVQFDDDNRVSTNIKGVSLSHLDVAGDDEHIGAFVGEDKVGHLSWNPKTGSISKVHVHERHRRKGIATAMWNHAQEVSKKLKIFPPHHTEERTDMGDAWAKKVGGNLPKNKGVRKN